MKREKVNKLPRKRDRSEVLFETLVRENERAVTAFLRTMVRDPGFVDDLFQETLITAWNKFDEFDPSRSLGPWLRGIAFNLVRNAARSRKRDFLVFGAAATEAIESLFNNFDGDQGKWEEQVDALRACVEALPEKSRKIVELRYEKRVNAAEIAQKVSSSPAAIRKKLQRIRQLLAECVMGKIQPRQI